MHNKEALSGGLLLLGKQLRGKLELPNDFYVRVRTYSNFE